MTIPAPLGEAALAFVQKLLGPVAEAGELLSDKVRLIRWQSALKIIKRAEEIARVNGIDAHQIPLKFLVPFIENASLEDETSPLCEKWAQLLAKAAESGSYAQRLYVDILSGLGPDEADLIDKLAGQIINFTEVFDGAVQNLSGKTSNMNTQTMVATVDGFRAMLVERISADVKLASSGKFTRIGLETRFEERSEDSELGMKIESIHCEVRLSGKPEKIWYFYPPVFARRASYDRLLSFGLIERYSDSRSYRNAEVSVTYFTVSSLGVAFVEACRGTEEIKPYQKPAGGRRGNGSDGAI